jgi:hypothetical protein
LVTLKPSASAAIRSCPVASTIIPIGERAKASRIAPLASMTASA